MPTLSFTNYGEIHLYTFRVNHHNIIKRLLRLHGVHPQQVFAYFYLFCLFIHLFIVFLQQKYKRSDMNTTLSLENILHMLRGLSLSNRQWLTEHLVEPEGSGYVNFMHSIMKVKCQQKRKKRCYVKATLLVCVR